MMFKWRSAHARSIGLMCMIARSPYIDPSKRVTRRDVARAATAHSGTLCNMGGGMWHARSCALAGKRVYYNFIVMGSRQHTWHWPAACGELNFFFMWHNGGVSAAWLRQ